MTLCSSYWIIKLTQQMIYPDIFKCRKQCTTSLFTAILILFFHFFSVYFIKLHVNEISTCKSLLCIQRNAFLSSWNLCVLAIWYTLVFQRTTIEKLFEDYISFHNSYKRSLKKTFLITNILTFLYIAVFIADVVITMTLFYLNSKPINTWYEYVEDSKIGPFKSKFFLFFYVISSKTLFSYFPGVISLLHFALIISLHEAITICNRRTIFFKTEKCVKNFIRTYTKIHKLALTVESAFNLEIVFMLVYQAVRIFLLSVSIQEQGLRMDIIFRMSFIIQYLQTFSCILIVILAANIHARDVSLRRKVRDLAFDMSLSRETLVYSDILTRFADSKGVITFTLWKIQNFERKTLLAGIIIGFTYTVIIFQFVRPQQVNNLMNIAGL